MTSVCVKPKLIISVYGGRKYFTMSEEIEKEFMDSLAATAITPGKSFLFDVYSLRFASETWIITSGLNNGAAKLIGEGVARLRALQDTKQSVTLLGMAWWGNIAEKARTMVLELQKEVRKSSGMICLTKESPFFQNLTTNDHPTFRASIPFQFDDKDIHSLEKNHTHFLLLDDGQYRNERTFKEESSTKQHADVTKELTYPKEMQRSDFVTHACEKEKCKLDTPTDYSYRSLFSMIGYGVTVVVEGGINPCLAILNDIQCKRPVVFVEVLRVW